MASENISFGIEGDEWSYDRSNKTYDLTRGSSKKLTVGTTQGPKDTSISIAPELSALVIVDMQNYFLSSRCRDPPHSLGLKAIGPTIRVIEKCREAGIQVIWLNWGLTPQDLRAMPAGVQRGFARDLISGTSGARNGLGGDLGDGMGRRLLAGSWNADIYAALKPHVAPGDVHCAKNRMSGLWNEEQPLSRHLWSAGARTLLFTGVNTDQCVLGTLSNAYNAGWDCVLLEDCCATTTEWGREVCLHNIGNSYGFVTDSTKFVEGTISKVAI
ncbi:MAG: hypothetical protein M1818_002101 [Claussenomyces sp. TS43310]|nr:MAG: hypothetical protein M1818_002101 [Claussenomyces sp. TS43310]